jgi:hypothetical protein
MSGSLKAKQRRGVRLFHQLTVNLILLEKQAQNASPPHVMPDAMRSQSSEQGGFCEGVFHEARRQTRQPPFMSKILARSP